MPSIDEALRDAAAQLQAGGVAQALLDARLLLMAATGLSQEDIIRDPSTELSAQQQACFAEMLARRQAREPVSRILGRREFWSMEFAISPDTLDPRADSETLISAALGLIADRNGRLRILDIGAGSGCLLLALLSELPGARGIGVDVSQAALDVARANAERHALTERAQFVACDVRAKGWARQAGAPFDLVIANPPYIPDAEIAALVPEVSRFDPRTALSGGADGLDFYRMITISLPELLRPGGSAVLEAGHGQALAIQGFLLDAGLAVQDARHDLGGVARAIIGRMETR
ncbi:MAG: release factor glutamine methyltransferase [Alphaproteobacteria bacterium]|nr:release factor glutamine methyltransferase [Alphaproteobacteria bacterium]